MNVFDQIIPFFVGHRTEILAAIYTIIRILSETGVIPQHAADAAGEIIAPLGAMTFASKISRMGKVEEKEAVAEGVLANSEVKP